MITQSPRRCASMPPKLFGRIVIVLVAALTTLFIPATAAERNPKFSRRRAPNDVEMDHCDVPRKGPPSERTAATHLAGEAPTTDGTQWPRATVRSAAGVVDIRPYLMGFRTIAPPKFRSPDVPRGIEWRHGIFRVSGRHPDIQRILTVDDALQSRSGDMVAPLSHHGSCAHGETLLGEF
mgnify:CR=1 FL=1